MAGWLVKAQLRLPVFAAPPLNQVIAKGDYTRLAWQSGYGAFSCSQSQLPVLINYIERQHEHHDGKSFEEELLELLKVHEVEYDERYLWN